MKTLQNLLDQLGPPPPEVCLDWAWQLRRFDAVAASERQPDRKFEEDVQAQRDAVGTADKGTVSTAGDASANREAAGPLTLRWQDVAIDHAGHLQLIACVASPSISAAPLVRQLIGWSQTMETGHGEWAKNAAFAPESPLANSDGNGKAVVNVSSVLEDLHGQTLRLGTTADSGVERVADGSAGPAAVRRLGTSSPIQRPTFLQTKSGTSLRRPAAKPGSGIEGSKVATRKFLLIGLTSLCLVTFGWFLLSSVNKSGAGLSGSDGRSLASAPPVLGGNEREPIDPATPGSAAVASSAINSPNAVEDDPIEFQEPLVMALPGMQVTAPQVDVEQVSAEVELLPASLASSLESLTFSGNSGRSTAGPALHAGASGQAVADSTIASTDGQPVVADTTGETQVTDASKLDIMADLNNLTESAVRQSTETAVPTDVADADAVEPLIVTTFPVVQTQTFAKAVRPREPEWILQLKVNPDFEVEPVQPQTVRGREVVTWRIQERERRSAANVTAATQVLVQAQLASARVSNLRWRVLAGAADLPTVGVPLSQDLLDLVQERLGRQTQWMAGEAQRLQAMSRADGIPSEARSAISAQRRWLASQQELGTRLLTLVADANQFVGWLDGQFEVAAELRDGATAEDSPPLLQFGQFELSAATP